MNQWRALPNCPIRRSGTSWTNCLFTVRCARHRCERLDFRNGSGFTIRSLASHVARRRTLPLAWVIGIRSSKLHVAESCSGQRTIGTWRGSKTLLLRAFGQHADKRVVNITLDSGQECPSGLRARRTAMSFSRDLLDYEKCLRKVVSHSRFSLRMLVLVA